MPQSRVLRACATATHLPTQLLVAPAQHMGRITDDRGAVRGPLCRRTRITEDILMFRSTTGSFPCSFSSMLWLRCSLMILTMKLSSFSIGAFGDHDYNYGYLSTL